MTVYPPRCRQCLLRATYQSRVSNPSLRWIQQCPKCGNAVLRYDEIAASCLLCGTEVFGRDGDWRREEHRRSV